MRGAARLVIGLILLGSSPALLAADETDDERSSPLFLGWESEPAMDYGGRVVDSLQRGVSRAFVAMAPDSPGVAPAWEFPLGLVLSLVQHEVAGHGGRAREFSLDPSYGFGFDLSAYTTIDREPRTNTEVALLSVAGSEASSVLAHRIVLDLHSARGAEGSSFPLALVSKLDLTLYVAGTPSPTSRDSRDDFTDGFEEGNDVAVYLATRQAMRVDADPVDVWRRDYVIDFDDPELRDDWDEARIAALWNALDPALVLGAIAYFSDHVADGARRIRAPGLRLSELVRLAAGTRGILGPHTVSRYLDLYLTTPAALVAVYVRDLVAAGERTWGGGLRLHALRLGGDWKLALQGDHWSEPEDVADVDPGDGWHVGAEAEGTVAGGFGLSLKGGTKDAGFLPGLPIAEGAYFGTGLTYRLP
ncbi:MAG: hypothetical protein ACRD2Z_18730 [Thermoanaerobaculia bacterium]